MSEEHYYRRRISRQQLEVLAQYMERYPPLALAAARSREGHIQSKRMWEKIARTLNRIDQNHSKNGIGWSRYWLDLKFKIRRKYSVIQRCQNEGTPCRVQLSSLEHRMIKILTDDEGNLLPTGSVYQQMLHCPMKNSHLTTQLKSLNTKIDDSGGLSDLVEDTEGLADHLPERVLLPDTSSDTKPNITVKNDIDPIEILDGKKSVEELRRDLVEFELRRQKELFEMEKQHRLEKHELEMSILRLKKQILMKELKKL